MPQHVFPRSHSGNTMTTEVEDRQTRRKLRLEIGRLRRRIDRRIGSVRRESRRLVSWRTYVHRYPAYAVLTALGFGMTAAAGMRRGGWTRYLGLHLARRTLNKGLDSVLGELKDIWADSTPAPGPVASDGAEDDRS